MSEPIVHGTSEPAFQKVVDLFEQQLAEGGGGAALCVYHRGRPVVDVWGGVADARGTPWPRDGLCLAFSTTKGVTATALHLCVDRGLLDYDDRVAEHWPEFAQGAKESITVRQLLCHEAGLHALRVWLEFPEPLTDWDAMVRVMERMEPAFEPGTANAYQAISFGYLVGELVHRVAGVEFMEFVGREIGEPLGLDGLFIGVPASQRTRVVEMTDLPLPEGVDAPDPSRRLVPAGLDVDPETPVKLLGPRGIDAFLRSPAGLDGPIPAVNGTFTARSIARMYAMLTAGGELDGVRLLSQDTVARATEIQNERADLVTGFPMLWRLGYHVVHTTAGGVLPHAFGHTGLGGSGGWASPDDELAICFTPSALGNGLALDMRFLRLGGRTVRAARSLQS